jgi:hypothetical protein
MYSQSVISCSFSELSEFGRIRAASSPFFRSLAYSIDPKLSPTSTLARQTNAGFSNTVHTLASVAEIPSEKFGKIQVESSVLECLWILSG